MGLIPNQGTKIPQASRRSQNKTKKVLKVTGLPWWFTGKESARQMQETRVQSLIWGDLTCLGAMKPVCYNH